MQIVRILLTASLAGAALWGGTLGAPAQAQGTPGTQMRSIEPQEFLRLAYSSATLQGQAAQLAASRDTRPEVKSYAAAAADFRLELLRRIEVFAKERNLPLPSVKEFEHQVIIENLEPLDYLALSRRYAEIEQQALEQEIGIYEAARRSGSEEIKAFAEQVLPELQQRRAGAQKMYESVKP